MASWTAMAQMTTSLETAMPCLISLGDDKRILFATFEPDTSSLCVYPVSLDDIEIEEVKVKKAKKKND